MKALVLKSYSKSGQLDFADIPRPLIKDNEILVQVRAAGLNQIDCMIPKGTFKPILNFTLPAVMGSDLAGVVVETGKNITRFRVGDAVYASVFDMDKGSLAEYVAVPESAAALKPDSLDFAEAAALPMVSLTSWQAFERAKLRPGQKVFIPAGSGGIGTLAIQLAVHLGATVATTTSAANSVLVRGLGASNVIDYQQQDFASILSDYDMVLGTVRGDGIEKALNIVKPGGEVVSLVGPPDLPFARQRKMNLLLKSLFWLMSRKVNAQAARRQVRYSFLFVHPDGERLAKIAALVDAKQITAVIDRKFSFSDSRAALAWLARGHAKGKVVVEFPCQS